MIKRNTLFTTDVSAYAKGSVISEFGNTKVLCTVMVEEKVPHFIKDTGSGWITSEYSMLPASTQNRKVRDSSRGKVDGRSQEIQRLIGRSLRSAIDLKKLGERTLWVDCDVLQADGGTRTAAITGAWLALRMACDSLLEEGLIKEDPITHQVAAISVGVVKGEVVADLCYDQDSAAQVDMNLVMDGNGDFIEIQGTGEESPFSMERLMEMLELGKKAIELLIQEQIIALIAHNEKKKLSK
ncbi:MAG: ribonuclease PH [Tissierellia bacterium]|nr:ribonuclease PH [Tissierellia bacterium]